MRLTRSLKDSPSQTTETRSFRGHRPWTETAIRWHCESSVIHFSEQNNSFHCRNLSQSLQCAFSISCTTPDLGGFLFFFNQGTFASWGTRLCLHGCVQIEIHVLARRAYEEFRSIIISRWWQSWPSTVQSGSGESFSWEENSSPTHPNCKIWKGNISLFSITTSAARLYLQIQKSSAS